MMVTAPVQTHWAVLQLGNKQAEQSRALKINLYGNGRVKRDIGCRSKNAKQICAIPQAIFKL